MDKIEMDNSWNKLGALLGIIASILIILSGFYFTPDYVARNLSPDGILTPATVAEINNIRMGVAITGLLILIFSIAFIVAPHLLYSIDNWFQKRSLKERTFIALTFLLVLACVCYLPFTYRGVLGERDGYRMVLGFVDSINSGTPFESSSLYMRSHSFGYYAWLYLFSDVLQASPPFIFALMNYSNAITAVLMVLPFFFVVRRYWGLGTAVTANLILMLIPVWWQLSRYGHPQLPAILFMFTGIALLCYRSHLVTEYHSKAKIFACDILIIAALSLCLMIRLDAILMFPLILASLLLERYSFKTATYRFGAYSFLPLLIFFAVKASLLPTAFTSSMGGTFQFLWGYHNPARLVGQFGKANRLFASAYPPILLIIFILSCLYLARSRKYSSLFFVLPVVLINYLFWLPNPNPARHFVYLSPTLSIGIAFLLSYICKRARSFIPRHKLVTHTGILLVFLFAYLSVSIMDGIGLYKNEYSPERAYNVGRFGQDLQKLPTLINPISVVSDAYPVIVNMQMNADSMKITREGPYFIVNNGKNKFIFCIRGWSQEAVFALRKKSEKYDEIYWLVDPYNPGIYKSFSNVEPPSSYKQLDIQSLIRQNSFSMGGAVKDTGE